jgi:hypothetical protein
MSSSLLTFRGRGPGRSRNWLTCRPAARIDRPNVDHLVVLDDEQPLVEVDAGARVVGHDRKPLTDRDRTWLSGRDDRVLFVELLDEELGVTRMANFPDARRGLAGTRVLPGSPTPPRRPRSIASEATFPHTRACERVLAWDARAPIEILRGFDSRRLHLRFQAKNGPWCGGRADGHRDRGCFNGLLAFACLDEEAAACNTVRPPGRSHCGSFE